jgi:hypothetical protein
MKSDCYNCKNSIYGGYLNMKGKNYFGFHCKLNKVKDELFVYNETKNLSYVSDCRHYKHINSKG